MPTVNDILKAMEALAPVELAEDWDNVGLLVGRNDRQVKKIMVMLDLDKDTLKEAIDQGVDMIVTHHPVIMSKISRLTDPLFLNLIENKISVCSMHTNLDSADCGVNQILAELVGLDDIESIEFDGFVTRYGTIGECSLKDFIQKVKDGLCIDTVCYVGDLGQKVSKICVIGGSGADFIESVKNAGFDVLLTADVKYHQAQLAQSIGLAVIDAGHFETENPIIYHVQKYLKQKFDNVQVVTSLRNKSYIKYE